MEAPLVQAACRPRQADMQLRVCARVCVCNGSSAVTHFEPSARARQHVALLYQLLALPPLAVPQVGQQPLNPQGLAGDCGIQGWGFGFGSWEWEWQAYGELLCARQRLAVQAV